MKKAININHRESCWDCQTRLECLLVSLVQLQPVTYFNEVKPYSHYMRKKFGLLLYWCQFHQDSIICEVHMPKGQSWWQWYLYSESRGNNLPLHLLFFLTFCFRLRNPSNSFVCRFLGWCIQGGCCIVHRRHGGLELIFNWRKNSWIEKARMVGEMHWT